MGVVVLTNERTKAKKTLPVLSLGAIIVLMCYVFSAASNSWNKLIIFINLESRSSWQSGALSNTRTGWRALRFIITIISESTSSGFDRGVCSSSVKSMRRWKRKGARIKGDHILQRSPRRPFGNDTRVCLHDEWVQFLHGRVERKKERKNASRKQRKQQRKEENIR